MKTTINKTSFFSQNLRFLRNKKGYTVKNLALKLDTLDDNVYKWETGYCEPAIPVLIKICALFKVSAQTMLTESIEGVTV